MSLSSESRYLSNEFGEGERCGIVEEEMADVTEGESELRRSLQVGAVFLRIAPIAMAHKQQEQL